MSTTNSPNGIELDQEGNLVFQSYFIIDLLLNLRRNDFINSDYFDKMAYEFPLIKDQLKKTNIDNQGMVLITLYAMLVIPKEIMQNNFLAEFEAINLKLRSYCQNTQTTYKSDSSRIDFIKHLRNAVAHGRISFEPNQYLKFEDQLNNQTFVSELPLAKISELINDLREIHKKYISNKNAIQQTA
ncbi:MAG: hypothetical protein K0M40_11660 [Prolixibacteraceae bacterium]|nr:hypothetical protein [Prolixibacteraceae bacterium]